MISFRLEGWQEALLQEAKADAEVLRAYAERGNQTRVVQPIAMDILRKWGGLLVPRRHGGRGGDMVTYGLVLLELAKGDPSVALWLAMHGFAMGEASRPEVDEATRQRVFALGLEHTFSAAISEAGSTSQLPHTFIPKEVVAEQLPGGDWLINGVKTVVTGYRQSKYVMVFARLARTEQTVVCLLVPTGTEGMTEGGEWDTVEFMQATNSNSLTFNNVIVPADAFVFLTDNFLEGAVASYGVRTFAYIIVYLGIFMRAYDIVVQKLSAQQVAGSQKRMSENPLVSPAMGRCDVLREVGYTALLRALWELDEWLLQRETDQTPDGVNPLATRLLFIAKAVIGDLAEGMTILTEEAGLGGLRNPELTQALKNMWPSGLMPPKKGVALFCLGQMAMGQNPLLTLAQLMS